MIFSDGDDRNSLTKRENADGTRAGERRDALHDWLRQRIDDAAAARAASRTTRDRPAADPFFPRQTNELDGVFDEIVWELANQYVLSYSSTNIKQDSNWRNIKVQVRNGNYDIRARRGYRAQLPQRAEAPTIGAGLFLGRPARCGEKPHNATDSGQVLR